MVARTHGSRQGKCHSLQNRVAETIIAKLGLEKGDAKGVLGAAPGEDIDLSPAARRAFPVSLECKNQETLEVKKWLRQCRTNAALVSKKVGRPLLPVLVFRMKPEPGLPRGADYAVLELGALLGLQADLTALTVPGEVAVRLDRRVLPDAFVCKTQQTLKLREWLRECRAAAALASKMGGRPVMPVLVFRVKPEPDLPRGADYAVLEFPDLLDLQAEINALRIRCGGAA